ncbi:MAG: tetratricopeptide repeat protein [Desulfobacteraceae bacterium]|nr:MAG: tetratricopeptide repeat protein [Desulfobacteraceae bacterium]
MKARRMLIGGAIGLLVMAGLFSGCATVGRQYNAWSEYRTGVKLFRAEKYGEAHEHAKAAVAILPDRPEFLTLLGWTLFRQSRIEEARKLFTRVHQMDKEGVAGAQGLAWADYAQGKYDSAQKWFFEQQKWAKDHMEKSDWIYYGPSDTLYVNSIRSDAAYGLGLIALARGRAKESEVFLKEALAYPNDFAGHGPILTAFGDFYFKRKDYEKARLHYEKALALKEDILTDAKRAWSLYHLGDKSGADQVFLRLASSSNDRRPGLYGLVFTRHDLGKVGEAKERLKELIRIDPYFADTTDLYNLIVKTRDWRLLWKDFAEVYFEKGDFSRAAFKLKGYLPLSKQDCVARLMSGWCALYLQGPKAGLAEFTSLSDQGICPSDQVATGKGAALLYLNRLDEAGKQFEKASRENPGNVRAAVALGAVAFMKGRHKEAIEIYKSNLSLLPKEENYFSWPSHALNNLGWSYIKTGQYQEAFQTFQKLQALHRNAVYPAIYDGRGWALLHLKRYQEAKEAFEQALRLAPKYDSSLSGLASLKDLKKKRPVS